MLFKAKIDSMGCLTGWPVNVREQRRIARHMEEMTDNNDYTFFIQADYEVEQFINDFIPRRKQKDLNEGWTVTFRADPWSIAHYYGWDCHTLYE